jgi:SH3 domain protein
VVLLLASGAKAETAYVTDMVQLDMYGNAQLSGSSIRRLRSGDKVEIRERRGPYARVTIDNQEGWVASLYLQSKEPARTRVNQLEDSNAALEKSVEQLRAELESKQARVNELEAMQSGELEQKEATEAELAGLREENARLEDKLNAYVGSVPLTWLLLAILVSLGFGLVGGWFYIDKRSRDRHGGYRVY